MQKESIQTKTHVAQCCFNGRQKKIIFVQNPQHSLCQLAHRSIQMCQNKSTKLVGKHSDSGFLHIIRLHNLQHPSAHKTCHLQLDSKPNPPPFPTTRGCHPSVVLMYTVQRPSIDPPGCRCETPVLCGCRAARGTLGIPDPILNPKEVQGVGVIGRHHIALTRVSDGSAGDVKHRFLFWAGCGQGRKKHKTQVNQ